MPGVLQENISVMMPTLSQRYAQGTVLASQTAVALGAMATHVTAATLAVNNVGIPWAGSVVGLCITTSAAATVGTLTATVTVNGTQNAALSAVLAINTTTNYSVIEFGGVPFNAGDKIGVVITTGATWNAATADVLVELFYVVQEARF
jgi:hypothetical protein